MTPKQLSEEIERLLTDDLYERQLNSIQSSIYSQIITESKKLEVDKDGYIKQNQANRKQLTKINLLVDQALRKSNLKKATENQVRKIGKINKLSEEYFNSFDKFKPNKGYITSLQRQTVEEVSNFILQDGAQANFVTPLKAVVNRNINSGGSYSGFLDELKTFIKGAENNGAMVKYANTWLRDSLFNYSRSYQQSVTADLKLEWYLYSGGLIKDSRDFCISRAGQIFNHKEIEKWAALTWQGKRSGTSKSSIFVFCGGWNCIHQLIPVSDKVVSKQVKDVTALQDRARESGPEVDKMANDIADKHGAKVTPINYKSRDSTLRKANADYKGDVNEVKDSVRNTIITDRKNIAKVAEEVKNNPLTTRFKEQVDPKLGYSGYLANVKTSNGTLGEVQINTPKMIYAKELPADAQRILGKDQWEAINKETGLPGGLGHKYYEQHRVLNEAIPAERIKMNEIEAASRDYYSNFRN